MARCRGARISLCIKYMSSNPLLKAFIGVQVVLSTPYRLPYTYCTVPWPVAVRLASGLRTWWRPRARRDRKHSLVARGVALLVLLFVLRRFD
jgi:hypothetical protein